MDTVFTSRQASKITGLTQRQLAYWRKSGVVSPSHLTPGGHARYTFTDLIALTTAKRLLDNGVSLQKIRGSITSLLQFLPALHTPLSELSLVAAGDVVLAVHAGSTFEAVSGQAWIFPIAELQREIEPLARRPDAPPLQGELFPDPGTAERQAQAG